MDIHHQMIIHNQPDRVYAALTRASDLEVWMGGPASARPEVGAAIEIQYDRGMRSLKLEVTHLEPGRVDWKVIQPMWPMDSAVEQRVTWTLEPYEVNTLVDFRMTGWPQDDGVLGSVSYKWATFMLRLKVYLGDTRDITTPTGEMNEALARTIFG